ncbi:hypothetical protein QBC34DRAFT_308340, partial [Podospora aff. communis PSN243]
MGSGDSGGVRVDGRKGSTASCSHGWVDSSPPRQVTSLLEDLNGLVGDAIAILTGQEVPWNEAQDDDGGLEKHSDPGIPDTELGQIAEHLADVVSCPLRLTIPIRNPAPHDDRFETTASMEASNAELLDIQHVKSKFGGTIAEELAVRLGKAISRRRQYFKGSNLNRLDTPLKAIYQDTRSDTSVTLPPKKTGKSTFECPICFATVTVTSSGSWRRHVYSDLRPYICLHAECPTPYVEFASRREWVEHELRTHWKTYHCPCGCDETFSSAAECRAHICVTHPGAIPDSQLDSVINLSARIAQMNEGFTCQLCGESLSSLKQYQRHVGRHQEQLSLLGLPSL